MGNKRQILPKDDAVFVERENQMVILLKVEGFWGALLARHARWIRNISTGYSLRGQRQKRRKLYFCNKNRHQLYNRG